MEQYRPIFFSVSAFLSLYILAMLSNANGPASMLEWLFLIGSASYIAFIGFLFKRQRKRALALILWFTALMPFIYYVEIYYINTLDIKVDKEILEANMKHVYVVYNLLRYTLLAMSFFIFLKMFFSNIRNFANHN